MYQESLFAQDLQPHSQNQNPQGSNKMQELLQLPFAKLQQFEQAFKIFYDKTSNQDRHKESQYSQNQLQVARKQEISDEQAQLLIKTMRNL